MGVFLRPRRPIARLAAGAATAGVAYPMGRQHEQQAEAGARAQGSPPDAGQAAPIASSTASSAPRYVPDHPAPATPAAPATPTGGDTMDQLERLASLHAGGALTDEEFSAAKARILGL